MFPAKVDLKVFVDYIKIRQVSCNITNVKNIRNERYFNTEVNDSSKQKSGKNKVITSYKDDTLQILGLLTDVANTECFLMLDVQNKLLSNDSWILLILCPRVLPKKPHFEADLSENKQHLQYQPVHGRKVISVFCNHQVTSGYE